MLVKATSLTGMINAEPTRGPENAPTDFSPPDYSVAARHRLRDRYLAKFA